MGEKVLDQPPVEAKSQAPAQRRSPREAERERLAAALRENLKRRKVQARARRDSGPDSGGPA